MAERLTQLFQFLDIDPKDPFTLYSIAHEYQQAGDLTTARQYLERLLAARPDYVGAYYHLADIQAQQGETDQAAQRYRQGMKIALSQKDHHTYSELQRGLNRLLGLDFEDDDE